MGWIDELYKLIDDETPAMEASDDITGEVNAQSEKVLGRNNDVGDDNNGEIDLNICSQLMFAESEAKEASLNTAYKG